MRKLLPLSALLLGALLITSCGPSATQAKITRDKMAKIGVSAFQGPLFYFKEKEALGPDAELARRITEKMSSEWLEPNAPRKIVPFFATREGDELWPSLKSDEIDFLLTVGVRKDVQDAGEFIYSTPYYKAELVLCINPDGRQLTKTTLAGNRVGVRAGTAGEQIVKTQYRALAVPFDSLDEGMLALKRGEIAGVVDDQYMCAYSLDTLPGCDRLEILPDTIGKVGSVDVAIAVRKSSEDLLTLINSVIDGMKADYPRILAENDAGRLGKVKQRYIDRKKREEAAQKPRQVTIRIYKDAGSPVDIYRFANLSFTLSGPGGAYTTSRIDFQGKIGYCSVTVPPGCYTMTLAKFGFTSRACIPETADRSVQLGIRFDRAGNVLVGH